MFSFVKIYLGNFSCITLIFSSMTLMNLISWYVLIVNLVLNCFYETLIFSTWYFKLLHFFVFKNLENKILQKKIKWIKLEFHYLDLRLIKALIYASFYVILWITWNSYPRNCAYHHMIVTHYVAFIHLYCSIQ